MTRTRQERKSRTRRRLIEAALKDFARDGLSMARTADIAARAGVSHGTVFLHFPTREDLLATAIEEFGRRVTRRIHELAERGNSVRDQLSAHLAGLAESEPFYTRLVIEGPMLSNGVRNTVTMIQSAISFHLSRAAEREMEEGTIRQMPFHLFFNTWIGLIHYYLVNAESFDPGESVLRRYGPELLEHFLALVKGGSYER
jgi:AcrR family transcriptional regulator